MTKKRQTNRQGTSVTQPRPGGVTKTPSDQLEHIKNPSGEKGGRLGINAKKLAKKRGGEIWGDVSWKKIRNKEQKAYTLKKQGESRYHEFHPLERRGGSSLSPWGEKGHLVLTIRINIGESLTADERKKKDQTPIKGTKNPSPTRRKQGKAIQRRIKKTNICTRTHHSKSERRRRWHIRQRRKARCAEKDRPIRPN